MAEVNSTEWVGQGSRRLAFLLVDRVVRFVVTIVTAVFVFAFHLIAWTIIYAVRLLVMLPLKHVAWGLMMSARCLDGLATGIHRLTVAAARWLDPP